MATTPSIAMIPSGYKDEKVYSVLPTNGDGDFTFARTTTATRVNSNGLIEEVGINKPRLDYSDGACPSLLLEPLSRNLIQYSEAFGRSYWAKSGSSVQGDPSTAGTEQVTNGDFATDSDWTKGTGWSIGGGVASCDGTQTAYSVLKQSGAVPINTNYKLVFTATITSGNIVPSVGGSNGQGTISTTGTYTFYTIASTGDNDLYFGASSDFVGTIDNVSVKEVQGFVSPSGTTSAFKLVEGASNGEHFIQTTSLTVADDKYSFTLFAKAGGNSKLRVRGENYFNNVTGADFDLTAKTATNLSEGENAKIVEMSNGWFKCTFTSLSNGIVGNSGHFGIYLLDDNGDVSWLGDGTNGVYIFGAQFEQQSYATSYIKNEGTAAGITRAADSASGSDLSVGGYLNSSEGVFFTDFKIPNTTSRVASGFGIVIGKESTVPNDISIEISQNIDGTLRIAKRDGTFSELATANQGQYNKIAISWNNLNISIYVNGVEITTAATTMTDTDFKYISLTATDSTKWVKDIRAYTTALSDAELTTLTTI